MTDVFAIQDEITQAIAGVLRLKLWPENARRRYTPNLRSYDAYLKARDLWFKGSRPELLAQYKELLERAIELDPKFALARACFGMYYTMQANLGFRSAHEVIPSAIAVEQEALRVDPSLPEANALLAVCVGCYEYDWARADRHWRMAMSRYPISRDVLFWYGNHYLLLVGRTSEAIDAMEQGLEGDPLNFLYRQIYARGLCLADKWIEAEAELRSILELDPSYTHALAGLGLLYARQGRLEEALSTNEQAHAAMPWATLVTGQLAATLRRTGNTRRAEILIHEIENGPEHGVSSGLAMFHALCGELEEAAKWAERAIEQRHMTFLHNVCLLFRPTPWWPRLAKLMNLPG
jgi:tetratricopeptide (TPR) repeat protein